MSETPYPVETREIPLQDAHDNVQSEDISQPESLPTRESLDKLSQTESSDAQDDGAPEPSPQKQTPLNGAIETINPKTRKKIIITYKDNLKHGEMLTIDLETGSTLSSFYFENDVLHGPATLYDKSQVSSTMHYKDGLLDGPLRIFHSRVLIAENMYKEGKQHGLSKTYAKSGVLLTAIPWVDGRKHGEMKAFHDCGQVSQITPYVDDCIHGTQRSFDVNGALVRETEYVHDQKHGRSVSFYFNGSPMEISHYKNDRLIGEPVIFDHQGNKMPKL